MSFKKRIAVRLEYPVGTSFYSQGEMVPLPVAFGTAIDLDRDQDEVHVALLGRPEVFSRPNQTWTRSIAGFFRYLNDAYSPNPITVLVGVDEAAELELEIVEAEMYKVERFLKATGTILSKGNGLAAIELINEREAQNV